MLGGIEQFFTGLSTFHLNILFLLGLVLFGGTIGGRLFQKLRIPQVVGYIIIGIVLGQTGLNIVHKRIIEIFQPFNYFALGVIGFMIGGELKREVFARYGRQFIYILFSEGLTAFIFVSIFVFIVAQFFIKELSLVLALSLLLGAIASATAPAATTDVLWEYRSRGPLTTTVLGIVALDDGLSLFLFAIVSSIALGITGRGGSGLLGSIFLPMYQIFGSLGIGVFCGFLLSKIIQRYGEEDRILTFSIGMVLLVLGVALLLNVDILLAAMGLGVMITNINPRKSKQVFELVARVTPPIYVLFFVLFGAKLNIRHITIPILLIALAYLLGRTGGKSLGAIFGAQVSKAEKSVQRYLPLCLFSQAGVAIGLSIFAAQRFPGDVGNAIVAVITTTTFVVQIIGPPLTRLAVIKSKEAGRNITEDDIMRQSKAEDIMDREVPLIYENMLLTEVLRIFSESDHLYFPVVDADRHLLGIVTIDNIKDTFTATGLEKFLLAIDLMEPVVAKVSPEKSMSEVREILSKYNLDYLPVVDGDNRILGLIEQRMIQRFISRKIMELHSK